MQVGTRFYFKGDHRNWRIVDIEFTLNLFDSGKIDTVVTLMCDYDSVLYMTALRLAQRVSNDSLVIISDEPVSEDEIEETLEPIQEFEKSDLETT